MVSKNRFSAFKLPGKAEVAVALLLPMMVGFLCSRAIHSISIILFAVNALRDFRPKPLLEDRWWLAGLPWLLLFALTYWWSPDKGLWNAHVQVKIPLLVLPLSFALLPPFEARHWRRTLFLLTGALVVGSAWSLSFLLRDPQYYLEGYRVSHLLPTPAYNDHIAYSSAVALALVLLVQFRALLPGRGWQAAALAVGLFLAAYLHILAAKTGLLALYGFAGLYILYSLVKKRFLRAFVLTAVLAGGAFAAVQAFPTLKTRIDYIRYTVELWREGRRDVQYSDMGRTISYEVAMAKICEQPLRGQGAGGMEGAMKAGYRQLHPGVAEENYLLPHNQYLVVALGGGLVCTGLFALWTCWPLGALRRARAGGFYLLATWLLLFIPLLTDPFLEMQFGVFVYLMFLLWQRQALRSAPVPVSPGRHPL